MSVHIGAKTGEIAEVVLLPGDPFRAKYVAEEFLEGAHCYSEVRGMYGFTGTYRGMRVSVQSTGMGQPSAGIYINELIRFYGAKTLIRIGSCGSLQEDMKIRDLVIALSACSDSNMNFLRFKGLHYAPTANAQLLFSAYEAVKEKGHPVHFGTVCSSDTFYHDDPDLWKMWAQYDVKAIEMETAQLYTLAAKFGVRALSILTVSDSLVTHAETSSQERERTFSDMVDLALDII